MKILMITNHSYMFYQFRKELTEELLKEHDVYLSTPFVGREEELKELGCHLIETHVDRRGINPITDLKLLFEYNKMIKEVKPDKVITYSIKPNIYASIICTLHKIDYYVNVQGLGTAFQKNGISRLVTFLYKLALKNAKVVFFENEGNANEFQIRKIIPKYKEKLLKGAGINLDKFTYQEYKEDNLVHFLFVGRIMKEKGVNELFDAMIRLKEKYDNVILDVVGFFEDEYKEIVEDLEKKGIIKFHGFQSDVRPYYKDAHCVVLPSYHEGMSNVLLEGSATGRIIVTSNIPGCKEAVDEYKTGFTCPIKDSNQLFIQLDKVMQLDNEQRKQMGIKAREKMIKEFDKKIIVRETLDSIMNH